MFRHFFVRLPLLKLAVDEDGAGRRLEGVIVECACPPVGLTEVLLADVAWVAVDGEVRALSGRTRAVGGLASVVSNTSGGTTAGVRFKYRTTGSW